jgi:hypothetical protein
LPCALACLLLGSTQAHADLFEKAIRGITIGPIENARHPDKGYGSVAYDQSLVEAQKWGANWVSLTPFGRTLDLKPTGVDPCFEAPVEENRRNIAKAVQMAHAKGLRVLLVPHLWVESGEWRALIDPKTDAGWERWADSYKSYVLGWAKIAEESGVDLFSVGVELRSWVTTTRAGSFIDIIHEVRKVYSGPVTYSANWDDVDQSVILGEIDVIGINAFYPLAEAEGDGFEKMLVAGNRVAKSITELSRKWQRPVMFSEIGYTTRPDPALRPWEWPDGMKNVRVDQEAQAAAYKALMAPLLSLPDFLGVFIWRVYADPNDVSQEAEWGFSPRGKLAELVVRDAFTAYWAKDGPDEPGDVLVRFRARIPGVL